MTLFTVWTVSDVYDWSVRICGWERHCVPGKALVCVLLLVGYQVLLLSPAPGSAGTVGTLADLILTADRGLPHAHRLQGLLYSNREGIISTLGYLPLYWCAELVSRCCIFPVLRECRERVGSCGGTTGLLSIPPVIKIPPEIHSLFYRWVGRWCLGLAVIMVLWHMVETAVQPASRRLCNPGYALYVWFVSLLLLLCLLLADCVCVTPRQRLAQDCGEEAAVDRVYEGVGVGGSRLGLLELFNRHQLLVFLCANVLTGAVNMSMHTIYMDDISACCVLIVYMCTLVTIVSYLN